MLATCCRGNSSTSYSLSFQQHWKKTSGTVSINLKIKSSLSVIFVKRDVENRWRSFRHGNMSWLVKKNRPGSDWLRNEQMMVVVTERGKVNRAKREGLNPNTQPEEEEEGRGRRLNWECEENVIRRREKNASRGCFFFLYPWNLKKNGTEQADERVTAKKHQARRAFTHVFITWLNTGDQQQLDAATGWWPAWNNRQWKL